MIKVLNFLIHTLVYCLRLSYRFRFVGIENLKKARKLSPNKSYLLAIWHQNLLSGILAQKGVPHVVIVSRSKDAEPVAYTCREFGNIVVRGSSKKGNVDKGGASAKGQMIESLKSGLSGAVTIDGPKGPAKFVKSGIIDMARKSGSVLVPYTTRAESFWSFSKSWDQFHFPKPFSKIIVHYGAPIQITENTDFDDFATIKQDMKELLEKDELKIDSLFSDFHSLSKENISAISIK